MTGRIGPRALLAASLSIGGGLRGTLARALRLLRNEGLAGVHRGLRIALHHANTRANSPDGSGTRDYPRWVARFDTLDDADRAVLRARAEALAAPPLISILVDAQGCDARRLRGAIASVRGQIYPRWELLIAGGRAPRDISDDAARIRHVASLPEAIAAARGTWLALLQADGRLAEHALLCVAVEAAADPDIRLFYADDDLVSAKGERHAPRFKGGWNTELFHARDVFAPFGVFDAALVRAAGGWNASLADAAPYDLALRCVERVRTAQIAHVPRVLCHCTGAPRDSAASPAAVRALEQHFKRLDIAARIDATGGYRAVEYPLPDSPPMVSLIIPTRDGLHLLEPCLRSILTLTDYPAFEILVIDNGSREPATLAYLRDVQADPRVRVLRDDRPFNYAALNNAAIREARGELIALVNNDIEALQAGWLRRMASYALRPEVGAVGARLLYPDGALQHAGVILGMFGSACHEHRLLAAGKTGYLDRLLITREVAAVTAACLVLRKSLYVQVGGLDEELQVTFNDIDLCLRLRQAGLRNLLVADAVLRHHESATRGHEDTPEKRARGLAELQYMTRRWGRGLFDDPYYNPNLSLNDDQLPLAWPPRLPHPRDIGAPAPETAAFNEWDYLTANPDIADLVLRGQFVSGLAHYEAYGRAEGRPLDFAQRVLDARPV